ncbi:MAG TPA: arabinan endo-1,5-alpha-L-arabinosidase [Acidobacteriaceae bacterium]|nr:arabinan endo-1,5-alpha-L-arabinosidase [Acidobacteriaceae bacterium]
MRRKAVFVGPLVSMLFLALLGCAGLTPQGLSVLHSTSLAAYPLLGDTAPVRDPSVYFKNGTYYLFSTDAGGETPDQHLPIRCSTDRITWRMCGQVFTAIPAWVQHALPGIQGLWAPDISYFHGLYHLYYVGSRLHKQSSVIGLATNTTLDPADPAYKWVDQGQVLASYKGNDFNALDPNIFIDSNQKIWLTYGSYWSGIKQREIDPATGLLLASNPVRYQLAARPDISGHPVEGASLVAHGGYYYLFLSVDHCCEDSSSKDNYKQMVGRSSSPNGPFVDAEGVPLMHGGGSILIEGNSGWRAPGGGTVYLDPQSGNAMIVFHAMDMDQDGDAGLWLKAVNWQNGWPVLQ